MTTTLEHPDDERFHIENVEPVIVSVDLRGDMLEFLFRCPVTDFEVSARIRPGYDPSGVATATSTLPEPRLYGLLENALRPTTPQTKISGDAGANWSVSEIEEAACDAFQSVSSDFLWDGMRWTHWEAEDRVVDFLEYSEELDALTPLQREVLRKVLEAVALADGSVAASEEQLLHSLLGVGRIAKGSGGLPSVEELNVIPTKTLAGAVVLFGYAIACVDGHISVPEEDLLGLVAFHYGIGSLRLWELKRIAQSFCVDETFAKVYHNGNPTPAERVEVYKFAKGLGLPQSETRQIEWRFLKRAGLA